MSDKLEPTCCSLEWMNGSVGEWNDNKKQGRLEI